MLALCVRFSDRQSWVSTVRHDWLSPKEWAPSHSPARSVHQRYYITSHRLMSLSSTRCFLVITCKSGILLLLEVNFYCLLLTITFKCCYFPLHVWDSALIPKHSLLGERTGFSTKYLLSLNFLSFNKKKEKKSHSSQLLKSRSCNILHFSYHLYYITWIDPGVSLV